MRITVRSIPSHGGINAMGRTWSKVLSKDCRKEEKGVCLDFKTLSYQWEYHTKKIHFQVCAIKGLIDLFHFSSYSIIMRCYYIFSLVVVMMDKAIFKL